ncbi:YiiX/YebB-like N1pC/P60 family cysteine hydrolase [Photobacterium leiognathi]|uniref:YiiX/YebB-like N1pC/P60 family cysteine hydrolase n=1 Tax=Photobacterium leiognathi TaxID=553611 RepID=UPI00273A0ABC|nr:YiiX/YebB-like N1pC/P60 family cysteine hydrolase [Photobacterium leiognathi]
MSKMLKNKDLQSGDVVLCYKNGKFDALGKAIKKVTKSDYVHAGIFIGDNIVAESMTSGLTTETLDNVLKRYDHVAIFRRHDAWDDSRVRLLKYFVEKMLESKCKYNFSGVFNFKSAKEEHQMTLTEQLENYFDGSCVQASPIKDKYFCSEFVADCFIVTGFIDPSAAVLYSSSVIAPGDIGRDATFGYFLGYLSSDSQYGVPKEDEFYNASTWGDIFNPQI